MKTTLFLMFLMTMSTGILHAQSFNIMSFNIRYDNPDDGLHNWKHRKDNVAQLVQFYDVDLVGMQEVLKSQLEDLEEKLPAYEWFGVGRDDGKEAGEFCPVFYRKDRLALVEQSTFWLSETCEVAGKMGWDAVCNRVVTWGKFKDKATNKEFYFFNTHFDHRGEVARRESAKLILQKVKEIAPTAPVFVLGDFNGSTDSEPYQILSTELKDALEVSETPHYGQIGTYNGFKPVKEDNERRIDIIFTNDQTIIQKHAIFTDSWGGKYPSDHFPVWAKVAIK